MSGRPAQGADPGPEPVPARDVTVTRRPYARFRAHTATRPMFLCRECGARWPCQPARLGLLTAYRGDRQALRMYLAGRLLVAIGDQPRVDPVALATRFFGWLPPQT